jgi:predicted GH43/DUF377 family glycosyl hydrolase
MPNKLEKALRRQDKDKQDKRTELSGTMGIVVNGNQVVDVPGRAGFVYVLLNSKEQELIQAFNDKVSGLFGLSVIVVWNKTRYEVLRKDDARYGTWNSNYLPKHGNQHSFNPDGGGGGDVTYIYGKQFVPLSLTPSGQFGAPVAIVAPYSQLNSGWHYIDSTTTPNITAHRPTDNQAKMVLVCLDWATQTPQLIIGTGTFSATLTGSADVIPYLPSTTGVYQVPIAGVRLVSGTTAVTWQNIYDVRQFFHPVFTGTASAGGGGSSVDTIGFAGQDEGVNLGTGTVLNVVGAGATFTRSGTVFNLSIPGGGSIDTGTLNSLYLRLDASNDPLTGQLIINPSTLPSIDGAALKVDISGSASNFPSQYYGMSINNRHGGGIYAKGFSNLTTASINQSASTGTTINSSVLTLDRRPEDLSYTTFSAPLIDVTERPISGAITGPLFRYRSVLTQRVLINPNATGTNTNVSFDSNNALEPTGKILELLNAGSSRFYVNASGTAHSNGQPLIKEAPVDGNPYVRKDAGWEIADAIVVGGGGGIGFVGWDEGIYLATGTVLNVTGAGATMTVSGTVFNLNVPGGGGGGAGVMVWDEGRPLSTGTILNVVGDELYISVSGSVAQINMSGTYADGRYIGAYNYGTPNYQIGLVKSRDLRDWKIVKEPILSLGAGGTWDDAQLRCPRLVKVNGVLYLYYEGQDGTEWKIGLARSFDSGETWTKYASNPILSAAGGWESTTAAEVARPLVYYDEDDPNPSARWKMWYAGGQFGAGGIGYAYSSDGLSWTKYGGNPVLTVSAGQWDEDYLDTGGVVKKNDGTWLLFYDGKNGNLWKGGLATFTNPTGTYVKSPNNPILSGDGITTSITSNVGVGDVMISVTNANLFPVGAKVWVYDNSQRYMATVRKIVSSTVLEMHEPAPDAIASATGNVETITSGSVDFQTAIYDDGYLFSISAHQPLSSPAGLFETSVLGYARDSLDEVKIDYGAGLLVPITLEESRAASLSKENLGILDAWEIGARQTPVITGSSGGGSTTNNYINNPLVGLAVQDDGAFFASGTVLSFDNNLYLGLSGTVIHVSSPITTYFRVGQPAQLAGTVYQVPDRVYASGSLGLFNNGLVLLPGTDYEELLWTSGTYQYLRTVTGTHVAHYGVPCSPQTQPPTGTSASQFALSDSSSVLLLDSNGIQLLDSNG